MLNMTEDEIAKYASIELAKQNFFYYCNLKAPSFYKEDREYLVHICNECQNFLEDKEEEVLIINLPPRHGKSRTAGMLVEWALGKNKHKKVMTGSYNETLSKTFSKSTRNSIQEEKADKNIVVYNEIFDNTRIKKGDGSMSLWSLEGAYNSYLATSPGGTATGFGADILIIDDLIKNSEEAYNENVLEKHWDWFTNTMLSRLEENGKIIIIMTRWASGDLSGRAEAHFEEAGQKVRKIIMKAVQDDNTMLCVEVLSKKSFNMKSKAMSEEIVQANYQQIPIDLKGCLYQSFRTYTELPKDSNNNLLFERIFSYCDTADQGKDYLANIIVGEYQSLVYVLDVYYTKDSMETTEIETARRLAEYKVNIAHIESNSGGRGFARNVERLLREMFNWKKTSIKWFHQSKNKIARILSGSSWVQNNMLFSVDWKQRYPEYHSAMMRYQKEGKNKYDDAPDATTGIHDKIDDRGRFKTLDKRRLGL